MRKTTFTWSILDARQHPGDLFPLIAVNGKKYLLDTPQLAAIPLIELTEKIGSAAAFQPAILDALDRVFGAY